MFFSLGVSIVKPYTVVTRLNNEQASSSERTVELLIKHYADRLMTPMLQQLNIGMQNLFMSESKIIVMRVFLS